MRGPRVVVCNVANDHWYPLGAARLIERFKACSDGYEIQSWVNVLPPGTQPTGGSFAPGAPAFDFTGYIAKPFAVKYAMEQGADIVLLLDASFYPIAPIQPLVDYVAAKGFYAAHDGFTIGQWAADRALEAYSLSRDVALTVLGWASGCVGFDMRRPSVRQLALDWQNGSEHFPGPHSNTKAGDRTHFGRNPGLCSDDPRCLGHRHDQSILSLLIYRLGILNSEHAPRFSAYAPGCLCGHGHSKHVPMSFSAPYKKYRSTQSGVTQGMGCIDCECAEFVDNGAHDSWPDQHKPNNETVLLCEGGM